MNLLTRLKLKSQALGLSPKELIKQRRRRVTIANGVSAIRIAALPFIHYFLTQTGTTALFWVVAIMIFAALTDVFDGIVARYFDVTSDWGKIIDPLADKICIGSVAISLTLTRSLPLWITAIIIGRDLAIVGGGLVLGFRHDIVLPSSRLGQITTVVLTLTMLSFTLSVPWSISIMVPASATLIGLTSVAYAIKGVQILRQLRQT